MKKNIRNTRGKRKLSKSGIVLIVGLCIILIPCLIFGGIILSAVINTGKPIFGDRYKNDLNPAINEGSLNSIENSTKGINGVEKVECTLISGQLRINIDTSDSLTTEEIEAIANDAYAIVEKELPIATYFTSSEEKKMYDLAINVYNFIDAEDESMIYYLITKNAMMDDKQIQLVSEPIDAKLASDLRGENIEPEIENTEETE